MIELLDDVRRNVPPAPNFLIHPWSDESLGVELAAMAQSAPASVTGNAANTAVYVPFALARDFLAVRFWWVNDALVTGNCDIGIYDERFNRLISTGSTVKSGAATIQTATISYALTPGRYYLAWVESDNSGSNTRQGINIGTTSAFLKLRTLGIVTQTSALPLPATATPAAISTAVTVPLVGISCVTTF